MPFILFSNNLLVICWHFTLFITMKERVHPSLLFSNFTSMQISYFIWIHILVCFTKLFLLLGQQKLCYKLSCIIISSLSSSQHELERGRCYLKVEMGSQCKASLMKIPDSFSEGERNKYTARFNTLDTTKKGYITPIDLRRYLEVRLSGLEKRQTYVQRNMELC